MTEVTQAERDYVAGLERNTGALWAESVWLESGRHDAAVRAIIDYIRANPLPEVAALVEAAREALLVMRHCDDRARRVVVYEKLTAALDRLKGEA